MNVIYCDKTPHENFRGKPLSEATNQTVKNEMQDTYLLLVELFCCVVLVSSIWKNVGMKMMMWCDIGVVQ